MPPIDNNPDAAAPEDEDSRLDLRATIAAAMKGDDGGGEAAPAPRAAAAPAAAAAADVSAAGATPPAAGQEAAQGDRARDPTGKFAKGADPALNAGTDQPGTGSAEAKEPIRPPASWSPAAKAQFASLAPEIQAEIGKRETDFAKGLQTRTEQLKRYEPIEQIIAPMRQSWGARGLASDAQAIGFLVSAQQSLDANPVQGLIALAKSYGIKPEQLLNVSGQAQPGADPATQAQAPHPDIERLSKSVTTLEQTLAQQRQQAEQATRDTYVSEIGKFAADPANLYFENVKDEMGLILSNGRAPGDTPAQQLANAYDMAVHMRPDIRSLIQAEAARTGQAATTAAARAKTGDARRASGSVTGAPGPGSQQVKAAPSTDLRATIVAAMNGG